MTRICSERSFSKRTCFGWTFRLSDLLEFGREGDGFVDVPDVIELSYSRQSPFPFLVEIDAVSKDWYGTKKGKQEI